ncbi:uncharacterized protein EI97DRAFT_139037 [Westerdykella ornata]|uniref:Uncharacterized protein n=1 Tax=Westerdykella ornata TaxID=318751 RepID=A0A6A6JCC8_WESOR|nr:uncharacterized protein EI97DRAFT_139037 [Westerdykella ornata]KAF2273935.1 hypothetical protein EI97DRAFT_139037 [Westerdykella ornata]
MPQTREMENQWQRGGRYTNLLHPKPPYPGLRHSLLPCCSRLRPVPAPAALRCGSFSPPREGGPGVLFRSRRTLGRTLNVMPTAHSRPSTTSNLVPRPRNKTPGNPQEFL